MIENYKKLLNVYPYKDIQHFMYLLNRAESCGMGIRATKTATQNFLNTMATERKRPERAKLDPERVIPVGLYKDTCPDCGKNMVVSRWTDIDDVTAVYIAKCKACQKEMIVEK